MTRDTGPTAIEARGISFAYPDGIQALADLSFRAAEGELVAVMGANGSGKTTLLKLLMRLLHPQRGEVFLGTDDVCKLRPGDLYRRMGMVFQNPADQLFAASVEEDVAFGPRNQGLSQAEVARRVEQSLAAVDALALASTPSTISATASKNASAWRASSPCKPAFSCWTSRPPVWTRWARPR